jgi:6-phosphofructokinase 2
MATVATLTMNPAVEVITAVDHVVPNRKLNCGRAVQEAGGGGVNVARAIRHLGEDATALFTAGGDAGARLTKLIEAHGVAAQPIRVASETRETLNVFETTTDNHFRFVIEGAPLADAEWQSALETVRALSPAPQYLVASGSLPPGVPVDFYAALSVIAAERGIRLIVDTAGIPLQHAGGPGTFLLKPNLHEVRALSAGMFSDFMLEGVARSIVAAGRAQAVAVSMGAAGAIAVWPEGFRRIAAPIVPVVSRAGAGDSMVAGIVVGLVRGMSVDEAVAFGVAAGSAAVMNSGLELCRASDVERLYKQMTA